MFFYLLKALFSGFLQCKDNFVDGQNNSKYCDCSWVIVGVGMKNNSPLLPSPPLPSPIHNLCCSISTVGKANAKRLLVLRFLGVTAGSSENSASVSVHFGSEEYSKHNFNDHSLTEIELLTNPELFRRLRSTFVLIREFKHDVYGRRQTAKVNSDFLFFSCNPYINHTKIK